MQTREAGPPFSFQVTQATDFRAAAVRGTAPMVYAAVVTVKGAGTIVLRPKLPRDGVATESFVVIEGQSIPGQWVELVSADAGCFPVTVWGY